jgi:hypothetical protein
MKAVVMIAVLLGLFALLVGGFEASASRNSSASQSDLYAAGGSGSKGDCTQDQTKTQSKDQDKGESCVPVPTYCPDAPDDDGDGIPNCVDPDYVPGCDGTQKRTGRG